MRKVRRCINCCAAEVGRCITHLTGRPPFLSGWEAHLLPSEVPSCGNLHTETQAYYGVTDQAYYRFSAAGLLQV